MTDIFGLPSLWRSQLMPAAFNGARFHCDTNARESGRRIVEHQFPKKDTPYAEDLGRSAREFTVRGYCIVFPFETGDPLYSLDYRRARDQLVRQLEAEGPGVLQLPTQPAQLVVCPRYRMQEEQRFGGFCTFDMSFQEYGQDPSLLAPSVATAAAVATAADELRNQTARALQPPNASIGNARPVTP
jgi:prophage DNA circulation protein